MPRMQAYLPDDLYKLIKSRRLGASVLLQNAVRAEVRRQDLLLETDKYITELSTQVGSPTARHRARARAVVEQVVGRARPEKRVQKAG